MLYCAITVILFLDNLLPYLINAAIDFLFLIALVVVSVVVGKPLSYLNCNTIGNMNSNASSALSFASALSNSLANEGGKINYGNWIGTNKSTCLQMKSIWGLSIALWYVVESRLMWEVCLTNWSLVFCSSCLLSALCACGSGRSLVPLPKRVKLRGDVACPWWTGRFLQFLQRRFLS